MVGAATYSPAEGPQAIPWELKPQHAYSRCTLGTSPIISRPSGVKDSGPFSTVDSRDWCGNNIHRGGR